MHQSLRTLFHEMSTLSHLSILINIMLITSPFQEQEGWTEITKKTNLAAIS